ncbi:MAG: nucleotidyltransferase family protein [Acidobacteriota bacterium]|nr:nucleotidyltransferase family protein [Acidobacteriota bacterium]MDH3530592.1 nucleotidyltransferase family protein [Acidobacteriota bacterium]
MSSDQKWHLLNSRLQRLQCVEVSDRLRTEGIECVVLKGPAIERFYPAEKTRPSIDLDIAVQPGDFSRALELRSDGALGNYNIDVHKGFRHFDTRGWEPGFERSSMIDLEEGRIRVLAGEDQLRLTCIHWLTDGGERKERLWDIHYIVCGCRPDFDWDYFLNSNGQVRREWMIAMIGLAHKYTGLPLEDLPFRAEDLELPKWLVSTLERRWRDPVAFAPLDTSVGSPVRFLQQVRRRFPPNAVMATVGLEGRFDEGTRFGYQVRYFLKQMMPSVSRVLRAFSSRFRK